MTLRIFSCVYCPFVYLLWRNVWVLCPSFTWVIYLLIIELRVLYMFRYKSLIRYRMCKYFPHPVDCLSTLLMWNFDIGYSVVPELFVEKTILSPSNNLGIFVENQLAIYMQEFFWTLNSVLLFYTSILMPVLYSIDYYSFVVSFEIRIFEASNFVLLTILGPLHFHTTFRICQLLQRSRVVCISLL